MGVELMGLLVAFLEENPVLDPGVFCFMARADKSENSIYRCIHPNRVRRNPLCN